MEYKNKNKPKLCLFTLYRSYLICGLMLLLSACSTGGNDDDVNEKATVQMPVVTGLDEGNAVTNLEALDLTVNIVRLPNNSPIGEVNEQDPVAGVSIQVETTVTITVSDGLTVPDLVDLSETVAIQILNDAGLTPSISYVNNNALIGTVTSQSTDALSQVNPGASVEIMVSLGVAVPNVVGMSLTEASSALSDLGFVVNQNRVANGAAIDSVINQDFTVGSNLNYGSTITLTISNGIIIPDLVGQNYVQATETLNNYGLGSTVSRINNTELIDNVFNQSPTAGTNVVAGTEVTLFVSDGVQVPDVVGVNVTEARAAITALGFTIAEHELSSLAPIGQVVSQLPLEGVNLNVGEQVSINVSSGVMVPDVVGLTSGVGESQIIDAGLTVSIVTADSIEPIGQILSQNVPAETSVNAGTEIQITVSDGLTVPPVEGMDVADARNDLEALGYSVIVNEVIDVSQTSGQVFEQSPVAGTRTNGAVQVTLSVYITDGIVIGPADCLTNQTNYYFVEQISAVNPADGGKLYDKWWSAAGTAAPTSNNPLWVEQDTNTRTGADTWRCKECHGWDYAGNEGVYGDTSNTHYTGFPGILPAAGADVINIFCAIKAGTNIDARHTFSNQLSDANILRLTRFIIESQLGSMPRGILDTSGHITASGTVTNANHNNGEAIYPSAGCASTGCHSSVDIFPESDLAELAVINPWETLHKIRFGHPGSVMPAFSDPGSSLPMTLAQSKDVLAYVQTLPTTSASSCTTDFADYVNTILPIAEEAQGGLLYDKWWVAAGAATPTSDHPLWSTRSQPTINTRTGPDTWRCKECHGWDYAGSSGVYGDPSNSHYTGFPSLQNAANRTPIDVFCRIRSGVGINPAHNFTTVMPDIQILHLTKFITASQAGTMPLGLINTSSLIASNGSTIGTNATNGNSLYTSQGCGSSNCHGVNGDTQHVWLGDLADNNPWETLHKIRFGHPGSSPVMPSYSEFIMLTQANDIVAHAQTLPNAPTGGGGAEPPPVSNASTIALGGRLYDNWILETGSAVPPVENPVWALQDSNNRTGAATWHCKECHGWDYKGASGVYGDPTNSHYTGFGGVLNTEKTEQEIVSFLTTGFFHAPSLQSVHVFDGLLTAEQIQALATFIVLGTVDTNPYFGIDAIINGSLQNFLNGEYLYVNQPNGPFNGVCTICHEADGQGVPGVILGNVANTNPWEFLHKIRFGQPATAMPSMFDAINSSGGLSYTIQDAVDIIQYSQSLPQQ